MAKKDDSRPAGAKAKPGGSALVPLTGIARGDLVARGPADAGEVVKEQGVTMVTGRPYPIGDVVIRPDAMFLVEMSRPRGDGPWLGEADKIAWRDEASGLDCIILRDPALGYLSGYVGVPPGHPLHGFEHDAVPADLDVEVHGGLTYSAACQQGPSPRPRLAEEALRICHVRVTRPARVVPTRHATDYRVEHDEAWWLGFDCNHVHDLVPGDRNDRRRFLAAETGAVYRDEAYVHGEVVSLAAQLRAVADGAPKPPRDGTNPPVGLDPRKAR